MKKILFSLLLLTAGVSAGYSQTNIKGNAIYWMFGVLNISAETRLANKWTFNGDIVYSPWNSVKGSKFLIFQAIPEIRFYPKKAFDGIYIGAVAGFHDFKMTKWNYINHDKYEDGYGYAYGLSAGYQFIVSDRLTVDVYLAWVWQESRYTGYYISTGKIYAPHNGSGELIPYKLGAAVSYRLGKKKYR